MSKLTEKILKEIKELKEREPLEAAANYSYRAGYECALSAVEGIIHAEDTGWIPVEERLPELEEAVWATVKHSEWISDYDADWVPEEEKIYHPESYRVYKAEYAGRGNWWYVDDYNEWVYCDVAEKEKRNLANVYDTVIAWMPLPDPYKSEE